MAGEKPKSKLQMINDAVYYINGDDFIVMAPRSKNLTNIELDARTTEIYGAEGAVIVGHSSDAGAFKDCTDLSNITIPGNVTKIDEYAFEDCISLESVTFEENSQLTSIGNATFDGCSSLTSVDISRCTKLTSIDSSAFYGCSSLTSVTIPDSVTSIGPSAFSSCSSLTSVTIPGSVTSIGHQAFSGCSSLTSVTFNTSYTWEVSTNSNFSSIKATLEPEQVKVNALEYLTDTYRDCFWRAEV